MKSVKPQLRSRAGSRVDRSSPRALAELVTSSDLTLNLHKKTRGHREEVLNRTPREGHSVSDTVLSARHNARRAEEPDRIETSTADKRGPNVSSGDMLHLGPSGRGAPRHADALDAGPAGGAQAQGGWKKEKIVKCCSPPCKHKSTRPDAEDALARQIRDIHTETRKSARIIKDSRARLLEIQKKPNLTEADVKELGERNELLLREMDRFDRLTKSIQRLVGIEVAQVKRPREHREHQEYVPGSIYEPAMYHEMKMNHPTVMLADKPRACYEQPAPVRSKSEIDLTRKLNESYDMQEKLVADNADLEVKRYILYKELMSKDQQLETSRAQVQRLQGELKMLSKENALLADRLERNSPTGDATAITHNSSCQQDSDLSTQDKGFDAALAGELVLKLQNYKTSTVNLERQLHQLEVEARHVRVEMDAVKLAAGAGAARAGACRTAGGPNTCFQQPAGAPPAPPMSRACGVCPPCPAPCNPNAPPTPAEKEVARLSIQLRQTEENFKTKVTECAMLRAELLKKKEELEKERCGHREVQNRLRELEMRFEGLGNHTNMLLGSKEQALEQEVTVRALKQCYRETREEVEELRTLLKEQNEQLQDYRVKYMQAQQLVEEQRRQMDMMDMDNTRISEQINLEIQRVKLKFQEKLQELSPIPELLKATQMRLKDAQQSQAIAEHNAEQLARELNCAREKVHVLLHNSTKPTPEKGQEKGADEKQMSLLQQRVSQLTDMNATLKQEIERLKSNVIRMEESVLANEKRLQEKMHECAQLGGELDRAREEAARALSRANERMETVRKCLQTTVAELERQLASARAQVKTAEKEREELQCRMQCQIKRLNENLEQAQLRIMGLTTQVQTLRRTVSSTDGDAGDADVQECQCKTLFDNP